MTTPPRSSREIDGKGRKIRVAFRAHADFKKADLDARQNLYRLLAERIWNADRLEREATS